MKLYIVQRSTICQSVGLGLVLPMSGIIWRYSQIKSNSSHAPNTTGVNLTVKFLLTSPQPTMQSKKELRKYLPNKLKFKKKVN